MIHLDVDLEHGISRNESKSNEVVSNVNENKNELSVAESIILGNKISKVLIFLFSVINFICKLYYLLEEEPCLSIKIDRFILTLGDLYVISMVESVLLSLIVLFSNNPRSWIFIPLVFTFFEPINIFVFFNVYKECSTSLYAFNMISIFGSTSAFIMLFKFIIWVLFNSFWVISDDEIRKRR